MKKCLKQKLYISKIWTKMVFKSFSFEARLKAKNWVYNLNIELQSNYTFTPASISLLSHTLRPYAAGGGNGIRLRFRRLRPRFARWASQLASRTHATRPRPPGRTARNSAMHSAVSTSRHLAVTAFWPPPGRIASQVKQTSFLAHSSTHSMWHPRCLKVNQNTKETISWIKGSKQVLNGNKRSMKFNFKISCLQCEGK
jgi:hypothetical protein